MKLEQYKTTLSRAPYAANLVFLLREDKILLAMKKRGFGAGRWNGVGGKLESGESFREAAVRETREEIGVEPLELEWVAELTFYYPLIKDESGNHCVHVYFCRRWQGEPIETEEMRPQWFGLGQIPFGEMWPDDELWLVRLLGGERLTGEFVFGEQDRVVDHHIAALLDR